MIKKLISNIIGRNAINWLKDKRDAFYSKSLPNTKTIGKIDQWTIVEPSHSPVVYSGGVGKHISFETCLIEQYQAIVYAFDPSPTGLETIAQLPENGRFHFSPLALSGKDGTLTIFTPVETEEGSFTMDVQNKEQTPVSYPCRKISSLMAENGHHKIDILKMDIEGSEYDVLDSILKERIVIDQICVEFHHFFSSIPKKRTQEIIARLKDAGYIMHHKHEQDFSFCHKRFLMSIIELQS